VWIEPTPLWVKKYGGTPVSGENVDQSFRVKYDISGLLKMKVYSGTELISLAKDIFTCAVKAVNPYYLVRKNLFMEGNFLIVGGETGPRKTFNLSEYQRIFVIGAGKATASMAKCCEEILGDRIYKGIIVVKYGYKEPLSFIKIIEAGHPVPDTSGLAGAQKIRESLRDCGESDLVISLISGGGSALLPMPPSDISLAEKQTLTQLLLECGATIKEVNAVRKHISQTKGGRLAQWIYPATLVNLVLSDVVGDDLDVIASGPFVPDTSTFQDVWDIFLKYHLLDRVSETIKDYIQRGIEGVVDETPKAESQVFEKVHNVIIGNNLTALIAASKQAKLLGFNALILSSAIEGEAREVAKIHTAIAKEVITSGNPIAPPACIISGGETTVTVKGTGLGGRNLEFCLAISLEIADLTNVVVLSAGTDGTDGPTDAAGAIVDATTYYRAVKQGLNPLAYLKNNDSYHFFEKMGDLLITGPTNTNVMDVRLILIA